jgi:N-acetyl-gamma-glutamyl-phosphate reductase
MSRSPQYTVGIVGARGHTGAELIKLIAAHPNLQLGFVSSRELAGQRVADHHPDVEQGSALLFENLDADAVAAKGMDAVILALPNGLAAPFVTALDAARPDTVIVDLSADHRFEPSWYYGLPELTRGDYPLLTQLAGPPQCFGVSGYSGAGTTPSDKNNPELLRDNLMPYALTNHMHEREVTAHLRVPVEFMPHVAPHFRGITMTVNLWLNTVVKREDVMALYQKYYANEALVEVIDEAPWVSQIAGRHGVQIGGFDVAPGGKRVVVVATLDNLLKGAATQAMQNLNLALGLDELASIPH